MIVDHFRHEIVLRKMFIKMKNIKMSLILKFKLPLPILYILSCFSTNSVKKNYFQS